MPHDWTPDEERWTRECFAAGDTIEQIAAWGGRTVNDIKAKFGWPTDTQFGWQRPLREPERQGRGR